jgi:hypothetical protein
MTQQSCGRFFLALLSIALPPTFVFLSTVLLGVRPAATSITSSPLAAKLSMALFSVRAGAAVS